MCAIHSSLWEQLIPSVIGGIIGATATVIATRKSIEASARQSKIDDDRHRKRQERDSAELTRNWVCAEIRQIYEMTKDIPRSRKFPNSAWESTKMHFSIWNNLEQKALMDLYNNVALYNEEVNHGIYGQGIQRNHGGQIHAITQKLKPALNKAIEVLSINVIS